MHADTDTGADVTARALALIGDAQVMAARPVSQGLLGTLEYNAHLRHAAPLLCDIAAAAVRYEAALAHAEAGGTPWEDDDTAWDDVNDCRAELRAAIRAAAEATP